jgi:ERCC4-type nuclease
MNLEIDYREHSLLNLISKVKDVNYKSTNLNIGDFIIKNENNIIEFIIERKSVTDLSASITDGRFRNQKERLLEFVKDPSKIIYIIEGNKKIVKNLPQKTINSAILNLIFKHHYNVIFTLDHQDTLDNILLLYKKVKEQEFEKAVQKGQDFSIKKSDKVNENIMVNMLSVIPGVSISIAKKIHSVYPTFKDLINAEKVTLSEIQISDKRKLGKVLTIKIINSLI